VFGDRYVNSKRKKKKMRETETVHRPEKGGEGREKGGEKGVQQIQGKSHRHPDQVHF